MRGLGPSIRELQPRTREPRLFESLGGALCAGLILGQVLLALSASASDNYLIVIADDIGVDKIASYRAGECDGGTCPAPPPTPTIDGLASEGLLFRNAWSYPLCSSSRAIAFTGRYGFRSGVAGVLGGAFGTSSNKFGVDATAPNIANELKAAGYDTAAFGKWHMVGCERQAGACTEDPVNYEGHPIESGFDYWAGAPGNINSMGQTYCSWNKVVAQRTGPGPLDYTSQVTVSTTYATVDTVDEAIAHIPSMTEPWLAWVAFNSSHVNLHEVPSDPVNCTLTSSGDTVAMYDAMTTKLDSELGRLLADLSLGSDVLDRTTIIVVGDNGTIESATVPPFDPEHTKGTLYEGGINVPMVVSGPPVAAPSEGAESGALVSLSDLFATVMDIEGLSPCPVGANCAEDSVSFLPLLGDPLLPSPRGFTYAENFAPGILAYPDNSSQAVRNGSYKLIRRFRPNSVSLELYNLISDPFEQIDLMPGPLNSSELTALSTLGGELNRLIGVCIDLDDADTDCVPDLSDNCPNSPNGPQEDGVEGRGNQTDVDSDGIGDPCDPDDGTTPDDDADGLLDVHETNTGVFVSATDTGTHPTDADSDDDLVSDGNEVLAGSDPNDPASLPTSFSERSAFLAYATATSDVLDLDGMLAGTVLSGATLVVDNNQPTDVQLPAALPDVLNLPGPSLDLVVVGNSGNHPTLSESNSLGVVDPGDDNHFAAGTELVFSFDPPIEAFGLSIVVREDAQAVLAGGDLELTLPGDPPLAINALDREPLGSAGGADYYAYFVGILSSSEVSSATLSAAPSVMPGDFFFRVDNIIAVPEPDLTWLLVAGCAALAALRRAA